MYGPPTANRPQRAVQVRGDDRACSARDDGSQPANDGFRRPHAENDTAVYRVVLQGAGGGRPLREFYERTSEEAEALFRARAQQSGPPRPGGVRRTGVGGRADRDAGVVAPR
ncbi:hypothetical protein GCM10023405_19680 [Streptomonospora salina]